MTLIFDLRGEDLEEEKYKVRVKVQGEADDGTEHEDEQEITIKVDRENHNIIITRTSLGASTLQCSRETNLQVTIKNVGKSDEEGTNLCPLFSKNSMNLFLTSSDCISNLLNV